ncbi:MAG: hypothetical protein ACYSSI_04175 [Planctomycetota bacterium]
MKKFVLIGTGILILACGCSNLQLNKKTTKYRKITAKEYLDKVKGGWLGQMAGVAMGGPCEFVACGKIVPEEKIRPWERLWTSTVWMYQLSRRALILPIQVRVYVTQILQAGTIYVMVSPRQIQATLSSTNMQMILIIR